MAKAVALITDKHQERCDDTLANLFDLYHKNMSWTRIRNVKESDTNKYIRVSVANILGNVLFFVLFTS